MLTGGISTGKRSKSPRFREEVEQRSASDFFAIFYKKNLKKAGAFAPAIRLKF